MTNNHQPSTYSLALGGWAARGLAHIGVYQAMLERGVCVGEVAGTSMGALVAAFIAFGKTPEEMIAFAKSISYHRLVDVDLRLGLLRGEKIATLLRTVFAHARIEDAPIPLRIVATCLETSSVKVFDRGEVVEALRASFSIPGIFSPRMVNGEHCVDGGILMNLPIQVLHGTHVIAVSATKTDFWPIVKKKEFFGFEIKSGFFRNNFEIIYRSIILLMKANEDASLGTPDKDIVLVRPSFGRLDALDFHRVDEFVQIGREAFERLDPKKDSLKASVR